MQGGVCGNEEWKDRLPRDGGTIKKTKNAKNMRCFGEVVWQRKSGATASGGEGRGGPKRCRRERCWDWTYCIWDEESAWWSTARRTTQHQATAVANSDGSSVAGVGWTNPFLVPGRRLWILVRWLSADEGEKHTRRLSPGKGE